MAALDAAIHGYDAALDGRVRPGHDSEIGRNMQLIKFREALGHQMNPDHSTATAEQLFQINHPE